jgi:hypothetical protein
MAKDVIRGAAEGTAIGLNAMNTLYLHPANGKILADQEFERLKKGEVKYPYNTVLILWRFKDSYAAKRLYEYYCNLPRRYKKEGFYDGGSRPADLLFGLINAGNTGMGAQVLADYCEWETTVDGLKQAIGESGMDSQVLLQKKEELESVKDIQYQLASVLKELNEPGFDSARLQQLKHNLLPEEFWELEYDIPLTFRAQKYDPFEPETVAEKLEYISLDSNVTSLAALLADTAKADSLLRKIGNLNSKRDRYCLIWEGDKAYGRFWGESWSREYLFSLLPGPKLQIRLLVMSLD